MAMVSDYDQRGNRQRGARRADFDMRQARAIHQFVAILRQIFIQYRQHQMRIPTMVLQEF